MEFIDFVTKYAKESSCIELVREFREQVGVQCKKYGSKEHYWNTTHLAFVCKSCGYRTNIRNGTVMESSKLPFRYWVYVIYMMTMTKKGISASEMQRQLSHKR